jgi:RNA polymerase sigma-70 factor (ECF subfamily)
LETEWLDGEESERTFKALRECIASLAPESHQVLDEHYFQQQTLESIAKRQGRSGGALRMMLFRVRKVLRKCIREKLRDQV